MGWYIIKSVEVVYELLQAGIPYNKKPLRHLEKVGTPNNNYPNVWGKHKKLFTFPLL